MAQDLRDALEAVGLQPGAGIPWKGHTKYPLPTCPFNNHAQPGKACAFAFRDGRVGIRCLTAKCKGKGWKDLCAIYPELAAHGFNDHLNVPAGPKVIRMDSVQPRSVEWLWNRRIPRGKVSLWFGEPSAGKSMAACDVTGHLTSGVALPDSSSNPPISVLYCSTEDAFDDTLQPRLVKAGADLTRVHGVAASFTLDAKGLAFLKEEIRRTDAKLLWLDPWAAYVGSKVDTHRANQTRPIFAELSGIASAQDCSIVVIHHPNKSDTQKASFRVSGSIDMIAAVPTAFLFGASPADAEDRAMIPFRTKISGAVEALGYRIDAAGQFSWTGPSKLTCADVLSSRQGDLLAAAVEFIRNVLSAGPRPANEVIEEMKANAFTTATINRAKAALGIKPTGVYAKGKKGVQQWIWALP